MRPKRGESTNKKRPIGSVRPGVFHSQFDGAKARARTGDRTIFSRELYQLSYLGIGRRSRAEAGGR